MTPQQRDLPTEEIKGRMTRAAARADRTLAAEEANAGTLLAAEEEVTRLSRGDRSTAPIRGFLDKLNRGPNAAFTDERDLIDHIVPVQ